MEASKLTISPENLRFQKLSFKKKAELRKRNIIDFIKSKPAGTPITLNEFQAVTMHTHNGSVYTLIKKMVKDGTITKTVIGPQEISYSVNDAKVHKKPAPQQETKPAIDMSPEAHRVFEVEVGQKTVGDFAKDYAWESNDDSLRGFIKWMDGKELDLRRMLSGGGF